MRKYFLTALLLGFATPLGAAEPPPVLVSIKPLHSLVASIMKGVGEPGLIVSGNASPHSYALKPSDARALERAKLVVWVGKDFETWLARSLSQRQDTIALQGLPGLTRLATREGGIWEAHDHGKHDHDHEEIDGHLWLDADNAARLVDEVRERLTTLDPANATAYTANAAATKHRITEMDKDLKARLAPVATASYVVFHDAHQYFEKRYGLTPAGAITVDPERPPGAKRMAALRDRLKTNGAACVFREPRFAGPTVEALAQAAGARIGMLDPEGTLVEPGPDAYFTMMNGLGSALADCLSGH
ncbi:High-affinity zinc uptake system protein ZnuA [Candidatus Terasakiella magnetica]|nr:High-affinity zinc uptake system protein ZnuA [Candidatus Terasakiella magnetica]